MTFTIPLWGVTVLKILWVIAEIICVLLAIFAGWFLWQMRNFHINF